VNAIRIGVPAALVVAATVVVILGHSATADGAAVVLYGTAGLIALSGFILRAGFRSNEEREREEAARRFFDEHGRWPGREEV
jgi:hypothetical protein